MVCAILTTHDNHFGTTCAINIYSNAALVWIPR
jgi:hypothetical protein